jgi:hypothetical protein
MHMKPTEGGITICCIMGAGTGAASSLPADCGTSVAKDGRDEPETDLNIVSGNEAGLSPFLLTLNKEPFFLRIEYK